MSSSEELDGPPPSPPSSPSPPQDARSAIRQIARTEAPSFFMGSLCTAGWVYGERRQTFRRGSDQLAHAGGRRPGVGGKTRFHTLHGLQQLGGSPPVPFFQHLREHVHLRVRSVEEEPLDDAWILLSPRLAEGDDGSPQPSARHVSRGYSITLVSIREHGK